MNEPLMKEKVVSYFPAIQTLSAEEAKAIADSAMIRKYSKGGFLVHEGQ